MRNIKPARLFIAITPLVLGVFSACATDAPAIRGQSADVAHALTPTDQRIERVETDFAPIVMGGDAPPLRLDVEQLMRLFNVPGLSIAVIDGYKIAWAKAYGVTAPGGTIPVTTQTLFQAGSLSKPVATAGTLSLVQAGLLSLDEDVNRKLVGWKVPENGFTQRQKVTLRRIMDHTSGLSVHGFPGYDVDEARPTLLQVLDGEKPANTAPVRVLHDPGTEWHYSGGGVLVEQQLVVETTHKSFPQFMQDAVFSKLGMRESSYEEPLTGELAAREASGTYYDGKPVHGGSHVYPEMAAAGLWTTPTDLANFCIEIALSEQGKANRVLSKAVAAEMLTPQVERVGEPAWGDEQHPDRMGLGFFLGDATRPDRFGHIGDDEGFQAMMIMFAGSGKGAVIMANSQQGIRLGRFVINNIAEEYGWDYVPPEGRIGANTALFAVAQFRGLQTALELYGRYRDGTDRTFSVNRNTLINLGYNLASVNRLQDAIRVMDLAVQEHPDFWNTYDSLADIYAMAGDRQKAIENYEKSIALNPNDQNAKDQLEKFKVRH